MYTFKQHPVSEAEKLWLLEALNSDFDPKVAKATLWDKLPDDFDPSTIDSRLYANGKLQAIGLWHVTPDHRTFDMLDRVISAIRDRILEKPGIEQLRKPRGQDAA